MMSSAAGTNEFTGYQQKDSNAMPYANLMNNTRSRKQTSYMRLNESSEVAS